MTEQTRNRTSLRVAVTAFLLCSLLVWFVWPSATVEGVEKRLNREVPIGTPRAEAEAWLKEKRIEHSSYYSDYRYESIIRGRGIDPGMYSGYVAAIFRDTDRYGLIVTGSIQIYLMIDEKDQVAKHIVQWIGTGP